MHDIIIIMIIIIYSPCCVCLLVRDKRQLECKRRACVANPRWRQPVTWHNTPRSFYRSPVNRRWLTFGWRLPRSLWCMTGLVQASSRWAELSDRATVSAEGGFDFFNSMWLAVVSDDFIFCPIAYSLRLFCLQTCIVISSFSVKYQFAKLHNGVHWHDWT